MKPRSQFAVLAVEDRQLILNLCSQQPYDDVVELLKKPRAQGGLEILTSRSALCRFFTAQHAEPSLVVLAQHASAAQIQHEQNSHAFLGAIHACVEARVLENLRSGKALADMEKGFRLLKTAQSLYLADAQWRNNNPKAARAAYQQHVEHCAKAPDVDFVPIEEAACEPQTHSHPDRLNDLSPFEQDILKARREHQWQEEQRQQILAKLRAAECGPGPAEEYHHEEPELTLQTAKAPVISPISPNPSCLSSTPSLKRPDHDSRPLFASSEHQNGEHIIDAALGAQRSAYGSKIVVDLGNQIPHFSANPTSNQTAEPPKTPLNNLSPQSAPQQNASPAFQSKAFPEFPTPETTKLRPYIRVNSKIGRNDPCPCGSGRKYKKCCEQTARVVPKMAA